MSIFEEKLWESDETGDKLANDLFSGNKKSKTIKRSVENLKRGKKKKSKNLAPPNVEDSKDGDKKNDKKNNKRKASEITIDEDLIKKWKSESINQDAKSRKNEFSKKTKFREGSTENESQTKAPKAKLDRKGKNSGAEEKSVKQGKKKKLNDTRQEINGQVQAEDDANVMTKSQKRRLKKKQKLSIGSKGDETISDFDGERVSNSEDRKEFKISDKSKLKLERIKKLLVDKVERGAKHGENLQEPKSLRERMLARLKSSRFRYLNEQMYNSESWTSKKYFKDDPEAFVAYHEGYKLQVEQWPLNPLDTIINSIRKLPKDYVIADFGCGEARLAESVPQTVNSLDLVAVNDKVTACDMAHTSLLTSRIDVVVFCLSLMGTNLADYLIEANRVLRKDGILKIAEVESRFEDVDEFVKMLSSYGFVNTWKDLSHDLFYFMDFKKTEDITKKRNKLPSVTLKSCLYKRR